VTRSLTHEGRTILPVTSGKLKQDGCRAIRRLSEGVADRALVCKGFWVVDMSSTRSPSGGGSLSQGRSGPRLNTRGDGPLVRELAVARYLTLVWTACCSMGISPAGTGPEPTGLGSRLTSPGGGRVPDQRGLIPGLVSKPVTQLDLLMTSSTSKTVS
jgi:hypothetical protein